jgi:hypothetical protein
MAGQPPFAVHISLTVSSKSVYLDLAERLLIIARILRGSHHGKVPKLQILTIADLFAGKKPQIPFIDPTTFRRPRQEETARQERLF